MVKGLDLSHWNYGKSGIDFKKVHQEGIEFIIFKRTEGTSFVDPASQDIYKGARDVIPVIGAYHFLKAKKAEDAVQEADFFIKHVKDMDIHFVALDAEHAVDGSMNDVCLVFLDKVKQELALPTIFYSYPNWIKTHLSHHRLLSYPLWIAHHGVQAPTVHLWKEWTIWQYTNKGRINGISGYVDVNDMDYAFFKFLGADKVQLSQKKKTASTKKKTATYKIKKGDTFWELEEKNGWPHGTLQKLNPNIEPTALKIGQTIKVPESVKTSKPKSKLSASTRTYKIRKGDTFWELEEQHGWKHGTLQKLNPKVEPTELQIGQTIKIPR